MKHGNKYYNRGRVKIRYFRVYKREMLCHLIIDVVDFIAAVILHYKLSQLMIKANNSFHILVQKQSVSVVSNETPLHAQLKRAIVHRMLQEPARLR